MKRNVNWTKEQLKLAFYMYCILPFGKLHSRNPEVIKLAALIGRTPGAVAMKLTNFASLDPAIRSSGRKGLTSVSALDHEIWNEFHEDWDGLSIECANILQKLTVQNGGFQDDTGVQDKSDELDADDFIGQTRQIVVEQRIKQNFFRQAVLGNYESKCCMSGISDPRLLVASHIVPWSKDKKNRLNPSNGLCLSAIHDKAFDRGLISLTMDFKILVSGDLKSQRKTGFINSIFLELEDKKIQLPTRFWPLPEFVEHHRKNIFLG